MYRPYGLTREMLADIELNRMDDTLRGLSTQIDIEKLINQFLSLPYMPAILKMVP